VRVYVCVCVCVCVCACGCVSGLSNVRIKSLIASTVSSSVGVWYGGNLTSSFEKTVF